MPARLCHLRKLHGLRQSEVASVLGMSQAGYSKYETGENRVSVTILVRLAVFYNTSADYLLGLTDQMEPYQPSSFRTGIS